MDRKRRSEGTSAVLIQGIPGVGKTHLARQYIVGHRWDYPGGIFWVRAKSRGEMDLAFAQIAHAAVAEMRARGIEANYNEGGDPDKTADFVVRWLSGRKDWLMVFDGVHFDTPGLDRFIPDVPGTSIIYTSTETAVPDEYRFDSPQKLELGVLTKQQAQELLLWELDRSRSWSAEDKTNALQLVELMGRLPIMIHQAAQQMKETREPLAKYLRSYKKWPQVSDVPSFKKVKEELENRGETAALNLISLLVWFDQHIPVEMVMLGKSRIVHELVQRMLTLSRAIRPRQGHSSSHSGPWSCSFHLEQHPSRSHRLWADPALRERRLLAHQLSHQLQAQSRLFVYIVPENACVFGQLALLQPPRSSRHPPYPQRHSGLLYRCDVPAEPGSVLAEPGGGCLVQGL